MDGLLTNQQLPWLTVSALLVALIGGVGGAILRSRARRVQHRVKRLFWWDAAACAWAWSGSTLALGIAAISGVEGLAMPAWLLIDLVVGAVMAAILAIRWRRERLGRLPDADTRPPGNPTFVVNASREWGILGAFIGAMAAYGISVSHGFGHPIHWVVAGFGLPLGYALALALVTPRYSVKRSA